MDIVNKRHSPVRNFIFWFLVFAFGFSSLGIPSRAFADNILTFNPQNLLSANGVEFHPTLIRGITIHPDNALEMDFIISQGDDAVSSDENYQKQSEQMIKDFLAAMTLPEKDLWVNLSPYEKDRVIPDSLGVTEMGKDFLVLDYALKQLTASLLSPEGEVGKSFWERMYAAAREKGVEHLPSEMFHKVWIAPEKAVVFQRGQNVFIADSHLKVMLEEDYLAQSANSSSEVKGSSSDAKSILRQTLIPVIEKEVNEGQTFARLRQIYHAIIMAKWYKQHLKQSLLGQVYADQNKTAGLENADATIRQKIYDEYVQAFQRGAYDKIREEYDPSTQEIVAKNYFSGGLAFSADKGSLVTDNTDGVVADFAEMMKDIPLGRWPVALQDAAMMETATSSNATSVGSNQETFLDILDLKDDLPFGVSFKLINKYPAISGLPRMEDIQKQWKDLQTPTRVFLALALLPQDFPPQFSEEAGFLRAIAYFRQLHPKDQRKVLDDISIQFEAYELAGWLRNNNSRSLEDMTGDLKKHFGLTLTPGVSQYIRLYDRTLSTARALRLGMEVVTKNEKTTDTIINTLKVIDQNPAISDVIHGIRTSAVVSLNSQEVKGLRRALRGLGIIEGHGINIVDIGDGQFYVYDENRLKREAVSYVMGKLGDKKKLKSLESLDAKDAQMYRQMWTESGLEDLIQEHIGTQSGLFYEMANKRSDQNMSQEVRRIASSVMFSEPSERLMFWDKKLKFWRAVKKDDGRILTKRMFVIERDPLSTSFQATFNREILFPISMEIEAEGQRIFNYRTEIAVLDDSNGKVHGNGKTIRDHNAETMARISEEYGIDFYHMDRAHRDREYEHYTNVLAGVFQKWLDTGKIPTLLSDAEKIKDADAFWLIGYYLAKGGAVVEGKIQKPALRKLLEKSAFLHIAGVRNRQALMGILERAIMGFDDDAPHGARAVTERTLQKDLLTLQKKKTFLEQKFLRSVERVLRLEKNSLKTKNDLYRTVDSQRLKNKSVLKLIDQYYTFDPNDSKKGLIPQALGQIRSLEGEYYQAENRWGKVLKTTNQRIDHYMNPQKLNLQVASVKRQKLSQRSEDFFPVNYVRQSRYLGATVGDTDLPVLVRTLRGLLASNASPQEIKDVWDRIINIVAFDFNGDTDTNGRAQFLNYILSSSKMRTELQSVGEKLLIFMRGSGSVGKDNWPVFNRMVASYLDYIFPTVGGPFRLEEPLLNMLSIHPTTRDMFITANGRVVGSQVRNLAQRLYVISTQDEKEIAAAAARRAYLNGVKEFRKLLKTDKNLQQASVYERYRVLGALYIKHASAFKLGKKEKDFLKSEQVIRAKMMSEMGIQRGEIFAKWHSNGRSKRQKQYREMLDMDMIMLQYATDFTLYDARVPLTDYTQKESPDYDPVDSQKDVFYQVRREGKQLKIQAVTPKMKTVEVNNKHHAVDNDWGKTSDPEIIIEISSIHNDEPISIGNGRFIFLPRIPKAGIEAIVPYVSEDRHQQFYQKVDSEIHAQVGDADGFQMLIWNELVGAAIPWREFGFLKRDNVNDLELNVNHLKDLSARIVDEMNHGIEKNKPSSLKMLDTYIHMNPDQVDQVASIGLIEGTGMNTSVMDPFTGIIYNEESGGFDRLDGIMTPEDQIIIKNFSPQHAQVFEKMVSGKYIGERVRQYLLSYHNAGNFLADQKYVPFLYQPETFSAELMTNIEKVSSAEEIIQLLKADSNLGLTDIDISEQDALRVKDVVRAVYRQAAQLLGAKIAGDVQWMDSRERQKHGGLMEIRRQHLILAEGSVIQYAPNMLREIEETLAKILGAEDASRVHISLEGSIATGGVIAALIAQNKTEGEVIVADTGGSNSRVYRAKIESGQQEAQIIQENSAIKFDGTDLRDVSFRDFVRRTIVQQIKDLNLSADQQHVVSWTFAFPVRQDGLKKGELIALTKGFQWHDAIGQDPVAILEEVLREEGMNNIQVVILLNDTPRRQLARKPEFSNAEFGANRYFDGYSRNGAGGHAGNGVEAIEGVGEDNASLVQNGGLDLTRFDLDVRADNAALNAVSVKIPEELRNVTGFVPVFSGYQPADLPTLLKK